MESFEEVATLDTPALRGLLATGRPEQRVWAIWALGLRTGGVADAVKDPDAGVRRTIAVMLASHGELDVLVALARQDPERAVRESAMQLVTRFAAQGAIDAEVVLEAEREDPGVRAAILAAIDRGAPAWLVAMAERTLVAGDATEQPDAFEALIRTESRAVAGLALAWLEDLPDVRARDACTRMLRVLGDYAFACELARAPRRLRVVALGVLTAPPWAAAEQLIGDDHDLFVSVVREGRIQVPIAALARAALDGQARPLVERLTADLERIEAPSDELRPLLPLLDHHYGEWIAALDLDTTSATSLAALPLASGDEDIDDAEYARARADARKHLAKLRKQIQRLMTR